MGYTPEWYRKNRERLREKRRNDPEYQERERVRRRLAGRRANRLGRLRDATIYLRDVESGAVHIGVSSRELTRKLPDMTAAFLNKLHENGVLGACPVHGNMRWYTPEQAESVRLASLAKRYPLSHRLKIYKRVRERGWRDAELWKVRYAREDE